MSEIKLIKTVDQAFIEKRPLSYSSMKAFSNSPKHYIEYLNNPFVPTDATILGNLIDCLVLTPEDFEKKYWVFESSYKDFKTKAAREERDQEIAMARELNKTVVTTEQLTIAKTCKTALMDHEQSRILIEHRTKVQNKLSWRDRKRDLPIVGYLDFESNAWDTEFLVDLKSSRSADPNDFTRYAAQLKYQIQCGGYLEGYYNQYYRWPNFIFLAVETSEPFNVSVNFCDDKYVEAAKAEWNGLLQAFRYCMDNDHFDLGYEFRLFGTNEYFNMTIPKYYRMSYPPGFGEEEVSND